MFEQQTVNMSQQEWPGLHPQKFYGGRLHIKPEDELGRVIVGKEKPQKGKKHFNEVLSNEYTTQKHLKTFDIKNQESWSEDYELTSFKKLPYIPPQRKAKMDALEQMGQKRQTSELDKFHRRIGMMTLRQNQKYQLQQAQLLEKQNQEASKNTLIGSGLQTQVKNKYTWQQREQLEQASEERRIIMELDDWTDEKIYVSTNNNIKPVSRLSQRSQNSGGFSQSYSQSNKFSNYDQI